MGTSWDSNGERLTVEYSARKLAEVRNAMRAVREKCTPQTYALCRAALIPAAKLYRAALRERPWG
jgi:hypothetical protein